MSVFDGDGVLARRPSVADISTFEGDGVPTRAPSVTDTLAMAAR